MVAIVKQHKHTQAPEGAGLWDAHIQTFGISRDAGKIHTGHSQDPGKVESEKPQRG